MSEIAVVLKKRLRGFDLDVGWAVPPGFTVLFGYSGSGKSLTLSMLAGTMRPDTGRVRFGDTVLCDTQSGVWIPPQERRIGYVAQNAELFPHMTVRGNVEFALKGVPRAERAERALALLERLHVAELAEKHPHEISGGQRQRCALARALALEPRALLLDEPLSALDLPIRAELRELLKSVQREQKIPVVMVTHDLYEAAVLADSLVVYAGNGVVQTGSPAELLRDPGTPDVRRLLHAVELPTGLVGGRHSEDAATDAPRDRKGS
jgi:molybdate transport system ATP-binding protein